MLKAGRKLARSREAEIQGGLAGLLSDRPVSHMEWGLQRIGAMLDALGHPERAFRSLHFAGTNGKGSAAAISHSVLRAAGYRAALYTSPHLVEPNERIQASGVTAELVDECADRVRPLADKLEATYFEVLTATAFLAFARSGVQWAAVETGLGGRLDATNVLAPASCGIVSVAHDHERHLGHTLTEIAREKAGILKPGVAAASGELPEEARRVVEGMANTVGASLHRLGRDAHVVEVETELSQTKFTYRSRRWPDGIRVCTPLAGAHQASNAGVALLALELALPSLEESDVRRGLQRVRFPGRFQMMKSPDGWWVLDIAHNPAGVRALRKTVDALDLPQPVAFVVGILADKPWPEMLRLLARKGEQVLLTTAPSAPESRRWLPDRVSRSVPAAEVVYDFQRALVRGRELVGSGTVVVTGSAYTVGDALSWLEPSMADGDWRPE